MVSFCTASKPQNDHKNDCPSNRHFVLRLKYGFAHLLISLVTYLTGIKGDAFSLGQKYVLKTLSVVERPFFLLLAQWLWQLGRYMGHFCPSHENLKKTYSSDLQIVKQHKIIGKENAELISVSGVLLQLSCTACFHQQLGHPSCTVLCHKRARTRHPVLATHLNRGANAQNGTPSKDARFPLVYRSSND